MGGSNLALIITSQSLLTEAGYVFSSLLEIYSFAAYTTINC